MPFARDYASDAPHGAPIETRSPMTKTAPVESDRGSSDDMLISRSLYLKATMVLAMVMVVMSMPLRKAGSQILPVFL